MTHKRPWLPHQVVPWGKQWRHIKRDEDRQGGEYARKPTTEERMEQMVKHIKAVDKPSGKHADDTLGKLAEELREHQKNYVKKTDWVGPIGEKSVFKGRRYAEIKAGGKAVAGGYQGRAPRVSEGDVQMMKVIAKQVAKEKEMAKKPKKPKKAVDAVEDLSKLGKADLEELEDLTLERFEKMSADEANALTNKIRKMKAQRFGTVIKMNEALALQEGYKAPKISKKEFKALSKQVAKRGEKNKRKREVQHVKRLMEELDAGAFEGKKRPKKVYTKVIAAPPRKTPQKLGRRIALQPV